MTIKRKSPPKPNPSEVMLPWCLGLSGFSGFEGLGGLTNNTLGIEVIALFSLSGSKTVGYLVLPYSMSDVRKW